MLAGGDWYFWDELPWSSGIETGDGPCRVVECRNRSWMSCLRLDPPDLECGTEADRLRHALLFHGALRALGGGHVVWIDEHHDPERPYPAAKPANPAARRFEEARDRTYGEVVGHWRSTHYLTVQWRKPPQWIEKLSRLVLVAHPGDRARDYGPAFQAFNDRVAGLEGQLAFLGAKVLEGDGLAAYLHDTVSRVRQPVRFGNWQDWISPQLVDMPINAMERDDGGALTIGVGDDKEYVVPVTVHSYPAGVDAGILDGTEDFAGVASLPITYRRVTRIAIQAKTEAVKDMAALRRKAEMTRQNLLRTTLQQFYPNAPQRLNYEADHAAQEVEEWLKDLARGKTLRCQNTTTFLVYHRDAGVAMEQARMILMHLRETAGLVAQVGRLGALESFLGTVPGNSDHDFVRPYTNTLASGGLAPLSNTWGGRRHDPVLKGPPLLVGTTNESIRHHVVLSPEGDGMASHAVITGPSGSGKTAAINEMCFGFLKYRGTRVFRIDKGRSAYVSTLCAGGTIIDPVLSGEGFQPLRFIADWKERVWAKAWLTAYVRMRDPALANDPAVDAAIKDTLECLGKALDPDDLDMSAFVNALSHPGLQAALRPLTRDGSLGYVFDAIDRRSYDADWTSVELDELVEDEEVAGPLMAYLWHMIRRLCHRDRPMLIPIDEAWMAMKGPFKDMLNKGMRTFRRENARVVFASQSAVDIASSELAGIIVNSCSLKMVFPDSAIASPEVAAAYMVLQVRPQWMDRLNYRFQGGEPRFCLVMQDGGARFMHFDMEEETDPEAFWMCCATNSGAVADALRVRDMGGSFLDDWLGEKVHGKRARPPVPALAAAE
jgi:type IV secretion system protein VirB4